EVGALIDFTAPTTGGVGAATCSWAFGDGGTANICSASHTYITIGPFNPTVTVTDALSVTASSSVSVTVNARLTLTATAGPNPTDDGVRVGLAPVTASGVGAITCSWDFGDTAGATGCSTSHTYTGTGTFTATVTATDEVGVTTAASVTITVNSLPGVNFSFGPDKPMAGESVNFTTTTTGGSGPYSFNWNYGDGGSGSGNPANHSFVASGTFNVTVTVTDVVGETATVTHSVAVTQSLAVSITSITPSPSEIGVSTSYSATATGGTPTYMFSWDFGDGLQAIEGNQVAHTYTATGTFSVTISAADSANHTATATQTLVVNSRLAVTAAASPNPADAGVPVSFALVSTGGVGSLDCNWSFDDGWSASKCNTIHTYATTGSFTASLTATDSLGVAASISLQISVAVAPTVNFASSPAAPTTGQSLTFTVAASDPEGGPVSIAAHNLPTGASFDSSTGEFAWTPSSDETGNYSITFTALDSGTLPMEVAQTIIIQVRAGTGQICLTCYRTFGLPLDDGAIASLGFLGLISALVAAIYVGMRGRGEPDSVSPATSNVSWEGAREDSLPGQNQ